MRLSRAWRPAVVCTWFPRAFGLLAASTRTNTHSVSVDAPPPPTHTHTQTHNAGYDPFDDEGGFCRSRFWLFISYVVSFAALVAAVWVLAQDYGARGCGAAAACG